MESEGPLSAGRVRAIKRKQKGADRVYCGAVISVSMCLIIGMEGLSLRHADQALPAVFIAVDYGCMSSIVNPEVGDCRPFGEAADGDVTPAQALHLLRSLHQVFARNDLITVVPLRPVVANSDVSSKL